MTQQERSIKILLVEDNPDDIRITQRAMKEAKIINSLYTVRDGQEALDFLYHKDKYQDIAASPRPELILLDINLPKVNGLDVLKNVKADAGLKTIPIVVLTVSKREEDVVQGYNYGCNSFIQKPVKFDKFVEAVKLIGLYWGLLNVELPEVVNGI